MLKDLSAFIIEYQIHIPKAKSPMHQASGALFIRKKPSENLVMDDECETLKLDTLREEHLDSLDSQEFTFCCAIVTFGLCQRSRNAPLSASKIFPPVLAELLHQSGATPIGILSGMIILMWQRQYWGLC